MGAACKPKPKVSYTNNNSGRTTGSSGAQMATNMAAADGSKEAYDNLNAFEKAAQDLKMDLGIIKKDNQYFANLDNRQQGSQDALQKMKEKKSKRNKEQAAAAAKAEEETTEEAIEETTDNTTVLDETTDTTLDTVEEISNATFGGGQEQGEVDPTDNTANYFDNTSTSVNSAAAQEQNQASALTTSLGEAEDEAIGYMTAGTGSNILNPGGAQGLLAGDDEDEFDPFNRRKTLIGA